MCRITKYKTKLTGEGRVAIVKTISVNCPMVEKTMSSPDKVDILAREFLHLHEESEEYVYMLCLNNKNVLTSVLEISHGTVNASLISTREVCQKALLANAVSIILIHNHPSGDTKPSQEDVDVTKKIQKAGEIIGIDLLDHIIIGSDYSSLKADGLM